MEYINSCALPYTALAFSDEEALIRYVENHTLVLLVSAHEIVSLAVSIPVVYLSAEATAEENIIYRYQRGSKLVEELTSFFRQIVPENRQQKTIVYMVYSPIGRSGKTTLALELARQLSGSLYIGMETYNSLDIEEGDFGSLLYSIMQKEDRVLDEVRALKTPYHGSYIVASSAAYYDLHVLDYEHLSWFLTVLCQSSEYGAIILDVDAGVFDTMEMLCCGDRLLVPVLQGDIESRRLQHMERAMKAWGHHELYARMEFVELPDYKTQRETFQAYVKEVLS